jgi:hypothetical protein
MDNELNLPPRILEKIRNGEAILFLGAGASVGATGPSGEVPPTGNDLRDLLADSFLGGKFKNRKLPRVAELAEDASSLYEVQAEVANRLKFLEPAPFHERIADFRWHAVVTTNYDDIIEKAYARNSNPQQRPERILRTGDGMSKPLRDPGTVPLLKIHGCISVISDSNLPLILSSEQLIKYSRNRESLFNHLREWGREHPIIFVGYDIDDPNIQTILFDIGDQSIHRPRYALVNKDLEPEEISYWDTRRVTAIRADFETFLSTLDQAIPTNQRALSALRSSATLSIQSWIVSGTPSNSLSTYIQQQLTHVRRDMPYHGIHPEQFYKGADNGWGAILESLDIRRRLTDDIVLDIGIDQTKTHDSRLLLVKGYAGSGKTVTLRRVAWELASDYDRLVFWLTQEGVLQFDLIAELYELTGDVPVIMIDDCVHHAPQIESVLQSARKTGVPLTLVCAARSNEWNMAADDLDAFTEKSYELSDLSVREIDSLIDQLRIHNCLGELEFRDPEDRRKAFHLSADRQLLVALHEATSGEQFERIVVSEYENIVAPDAKSLYLDVCTFHRFGVGLRAGLLARISGITMNLFERRFFRPLEHVVSTYFDVSSRDYAYRSRHRVIADMVFREVLNDAERRAAQIMRIVGSMNVEYESDAVAFEQMIRGRELADLFSDRSYADRIFDEAHKGTGNTSHIEHQRAVFELHHPGGSVDAALNAVEAALTNRNGSLGAIRHTKAMALRAKAQDARTDLQKTKLRGDAKEILQRLMRRTRTSHAFHTYGLILLDEISDKVRASTDSADVDEHVLAQDMEEFEKTLSEAMQRFPEEIRLQSLEANFGKVLGDSPRVERALERALNTNPGDPYAASRLARIRIGKGDTESPLNILAECIEHNPASKLARFRYARELIDYGERDHRELIDKHLRASFSEGDSNYYAQFWYARHQYLYGDRDTATRVFRDLTKARVPPDIRNKSMGVMVDSDDSPQVFVGRVRTVHENYCFVDIPQWNERLFIHCSEFESQEWQNVKVGSRVSVQIAFNFKGPTGVRAELTPS